MKYPRRNTFPYLKIPTNILQFSAFVRFPCTGVRARLTSRGHSWSKQQATEQTVLQSRRNLATIASVLLIIINFLAYNQNKWKEGGSIKTWKKSKLIIATHVECIAKRLTDRKNIKRAHDPGGISFSYSYVTARLKPQASPSVRQRNRTNKKTGFIFVH